MPRVPTTGTVRLIEYSAVPRCCGAFIGGHSLIDYKAGNRSLIDYRAEPKPRGVISRTWRLIDYRAGLMPRIATTGTMRLIDYRAGLMPRVATTGTVRLIKYRAGPRCCGVLFGGRTFIDNNAGHRSLID